MGNRSSIPKETLPLRSTNSHTETEVGMPPPPPQRPQRALRGIIVNCGDIVRCHEFEMLKRYNPSQQESFLKEIANQRCVVVSLCRQTRKLTLLGLIERNCEFGKIAGNVDTFSCTLEKQGTKTQIADGSFVRIGSYVKIDATGFGTDVAGVVIHIFHPEMIAVQFATGSIVHYPSNVLVPSLPSKIQTQDKFGNWIGVNSPVRVIKNQHKLVSLQEANNLRCDLTHLQLMGKMVSIVSIELVPYIFDQDIVVISEGRNYTLNLKLVAKVDQAEDSTGYYIQIGDSVKLVEDVMQIKKLQTSEFKGWKQSLENKIGEIGRIGDFNVSTKRPVTNLRAKIHYSDGQVFLINPRALTKVKSSEEERMYMTLNDTEKSSFIYATQFNTPACILPAEGGAIEMMLKRSEGNVGNGEPIVIPKESLVEFSKLGEGKFGNVYSALWNKKACAIKKFKNWHEQDVIKEVKIQASLKHPNIVELYGVNFEDDNMCIIMQIVHGDDLYHRLWEMSTSMSIPSLLRMAMQLANATSYLHEKGYLHGDIKSSNVMVETTTGNAILCDFGSAKFLGVGRGNRTLYTENRCGTLFYMAPECVKLNEENKYQKPTFKSDIWCLGVMFLEMFTTRELGEFYETVTSYKASGNTAYLQLLWSNLPSEIKDIIAISIRIEPENRPTSSQIHNSFLRKLEI